MQHVIDGLKQGKTFRREFGIDGIEQVRPVSSSRFEHSTSSNGHGGVCELDIAVLSDTTRWSRYGWRQV